MSTIIIAIVILIIAGAALRSSLKHFTGEGGCCGGGGTLKPDKKKLKNKVIKTETFHVEGMKCENCAYKVTDAINAIEGAAAKVNHKKNTAVVSYDREVDAQIVKDAIQKAGYTVVNE